jgi:hypothetical protein
MIATWIINRQRPLLIVEDTEFLEIFRYLNPAMKTLKADAIKNIIINSYEKSKVNVKV